MKPNRREFLAATAAAAAAATLPNPLRAGAPSGLPTAAPPMKLAAAAAKPVIVRTIEVLKASETELFVKVESADGVSGMVQASERLDLLLPLMKELVIPFIVGKDLRALATLIDDVYRWGRNYKYAGMSLWVPVACVEMASLDLLGKLEAKPVAALFGEIRAEKVAIYASSFDRNLSAEATVAKVGEEIARTGVRAIKLKIGGRMSNDADSLPGRTEALIPLARKTFGGDMALFVDANSSYSWPKAVEIGRLLEANGYGFFEEPCPWQDYESTRKTADSLEIPIAGGEQDSSLYLFQMMIERRVVDIVQPDFWYNGGFIRALRVAEMAAAAGMTVTPHSPQWGPGSAIKLQFASIVRNAGVFQEHRADKKPLGWCSPDFAIRNGEVTVPTGAGWGVAIDPEFLAGAEVVLKG